MYYLVVYDVHTKRVAKVHKTLISYMHWVQNSVFEGELTPATMAELQKKLRKLIRKESDSVIIFELGEHSYRSKKVIGIEKSPIEHFL
ncbi:MAG: CRISPR-associated endonuclease Cas2 [Fidelibacterota bacterium]